MNWKIYKDKKLTEPVTDPINLGKLKAGEKKIFIYYVYNSGQDPFDEVKFSVDNKDVKIISPMDKVDIKEKSSVKIILEWHPSVSVKQGLQTSLKIAGFQVIG